MSYKVVRKFQDDNGKVYEVGDNYSTKLSDARKNTLTTNKNKYKKVYLESVEEEVDYDSHTVAELKELADDKELDYKYDIKKANLIELLEK